MDETQLPTEISLDDFDPTALDVGQGGGDVGGLPTEISLDEFDPTTAPEQPANRESDWLGAAGRGVKAAVLPTEMTKEDYEGDRTKGEIATEIGANIATDIAATAALGAGIGMVAGPAGAAVGAIAAPIVLGLYRGFGTEYSRSRALGQKFDPIRGLVGTAAEINPLTRGPYGKVVKGLTQAVLAGGTEMMYSKDPAAAGITGAIAGAAAGAFHQRGNGWATLLGEAGTRPLSKGTHAGMGKAEVADFADAVAGDAKAIGPRAEKMAAKIQAEDPGWFKLGNKLDSVDEKVMAEMDDFKTWRVRQPGLRADSDDVSGAFDHWRKTVKPEVVEDAYANFKMQKVGLAATAEYNREVAKGISPKLNDVLEGGLADWFRGIEFVARKMDDKLNTNIEGTVRKFTEAKDRQSVIMAGYLGKANKLVQQGRKIGLDNEKIGRWLAQDDMGVKVTLSPDELKVAQGWQDLFEQARTGLKKAGLDVDYIGTGAVWGENWQKLAKREDGWIRYLPMRAKGGADMGTSLRREVKRLKRDFGDDFLDHAESGDLRKVAANLLKLEPHEIATPSQIDEAITAALDPRAKKSMQGFEAGATFQRVGSVPEAFRDFDVGSLFTNYLNNNFKSVFYDDAFQQLGSQIEILKRMGWDRSAKYLERYMDDMSGRVSDRVGKTQMRINQHKMSMDKLIEDVGEESLTGRVASVRKHQSEFLSYVTGQLYPNYLGYNVKAAVRNYFQPFLTTAPELGWGYGTSLARKALAKTANEKLKGANLEQFLQSKNLAPGKHFGEAGEIGEGGLRAMKGVGRAVEALEAMQGSDNWKQAMFFYSKSDIWNRHVTYNMGQQVAKDAMAGNERALDFLANKLSAGGKAALRKKLSDGKVEEIGDEIGRYLINKTQFNYGRESMNQFGREFGRVFSMFTKWPVMIMSDSAELLEKHGKAAGSAKVFQRYMAPMIALGLVGEHVVNVKENPVLSYTLGSDWTDMAPAQSMKVGAGPAITTAMDAGKAMLAAFEGDMDEVGKFAGRTALSYIPGMGPVNEYKRMEKAFNPE